MDEHAPFASGALSHGRNPSPLIIKREELEIRDAGRRGRLLLRSPRHAGETAAAAASLDIGASLPSAGTSSASRGRSILGLAPDEWLILTPAHEACELTMRLRGQLNALGWSVADVSSAYATIRLHGVRGIDLLQKGSSAPIDSLPVQGCTATRIGKFHIVVHAVSVDPAIEVHVPRSYARSFWMWLSDSSAEWGATAPP